MAEGAEAQQPQVKSEAEEPVKPEEAVTEEADVLEEDDDFEEFEDGAWNDIERSGEEDVEWEDNWDDEVEGEDDFAKRLRAELAANRGK